MSGAVLGQMLAAAAKAAGGVWNNVQGDVTTFSQNLIRDSAQLGPTLRRRRSMRTS
jgi:hypothetical protein